MVIIFVDPIDYMYVCGDILDRICEEHIQPRKHDVCVLGHANHTAPTRHPGLDDADQVDQGSVCSETDQ